MALETHDTPPEQPCLRILLVEDSEDDAELIILTLQRQGILCHARRVFALDELRSALQAETWDLLISDYALGGFTAYEALGIFRESGQLIPFIVVTGSIGEESAVAMMKAGMNDFVLKTHLKRLPGVVERELRDARTRRAKHEAEAALRESQERYALAIRGAKDGIWDWNIRESTMYVSPRWRALLGFSETDDIAPTKALWESVLHPDDIVQVHRQIVDHLKQLTPHFEIEHRVRHADGSWRWMHSRGLAMYDPETGRAFRMAGSMSDITERKRADEQLLYDALHDGLTGLANRALFADFLGHALHHASRDPDYHCAVLCLNLERFRYINDSFGHGVGDRILRITAERLSRVRRGGDVLARLGGDEFALLLDDVHDVNEVAIFTEAMLAELAQPVHIEGHEVYPGARVGIALSAPRYGHPEEMIRDADTAMHRAKSQGKVKYEVFDGTMQGLMLRALKMEQEMRRALEAHEYVAYYQPIINLSTGAITAFEALVRWQKADGLVSPAEFIPLAEEIGLINQIGLQMLQMSTRQIARWQELFPELNLRISVNLSGRQFHQPGLVGQVDACIAEAGIEPHLLELEVTESILMDHSVSIISMLQAFRSRGIDILMDDFGTGYSSLSYLHRFPSNVLKIDGSFVKRLDDAEDSGEIVKTIMLLGHNLGMSVIAEGVETARQLAILRGMGCDYAQGYFFAKPLHADAATALIERQPRW